MMKLSAVDLVLFLRVGPRWVFLTVKMRNRMRFRKRWL